MAWKKELYIVPPPPSLDDHPPRTVGVTLADTVESPPDRVTLGDFLALAFVGTAAGIILGSLFSRPICDLIAWVLG